MQKWLIKNKKANYSEMSRALKVSELICKIMINRNITGFELMESFVNPTLDKLHNPRLMKDIELGAGLVKKAIEDNKKIRVCGDYDQDGNSSVLTLLNGIKKCGGDVDYVIPHRVKDGYGINEDIVKRASDDNIDLIITCDNGISAHSAVEYARELGIEIIVTDHHDVGETLPNGHAVINPKRQDCSYPFKELCGAGVAFKFVQVLYEDFKIDSDELFKLLEFVAMATVCDIVDLVDENRIIVKEGLSRINKTENIGIKALIKATGLEGKEITTYALGFVTGPCVNAGGRLDTADIAVELFLTDDEQLATEYAEKLHHLNEERKEMTKSGVESILDYVEKNIGDDQKVIVAYNPTIHESIAGIIAGRVKDKYHKPTLVITDTAGDGMSKGSARSIEQYNMYEELCGVSELLEKFGGHPMAAGFSIKTSNIDSLRNALNKNETLTEDDLIPKLYIDGHIPVESLNMKMTEELDILEPFGKGNRKPLFADKGLIMKKMDILGSNYRIIKSTLSKNGKFVTAVYFGDIEQWEEYLTEKFGEDEVQRAFNGQDNDITLDITYRPSINEFRGRKSLQIIIEDYR